MKAPKIIGNIFAWIKGKALAKPLNPRTTLAISTIAIIICTIPAAVLFFTMKSMMEAIYVFNEEVNVPTIDIIGIALLILFIIVTISFSLTRIIRTLQVAREKRKAYSKKKDRK